jgi:hypothetical protein
MESLGAYSDPVSIKSAITSSLAGISMYQMSRKPEATLYELCAWCYKQLVGPCEHFLCNPCGVVRGACGHGLHEHCYNKWFDLFFLFFLTFVGFTFL